MSSGGEKKSTRNSKALINKMRMSSVSIQRHNPNDQLRILRKLAGPREGGGSDQHCPHSCPWVPRTTTNTEKSESRVVMAFCLSFLPTLLSTKGQKWLSSLCEKQGIIAYLTFFLNQIIMKKAHPKQIDKWSLPCFCPGQENQSFLCPVSWWVTCWKNQGSLFPGDHCSAVSFPGSIPLSSLPFALLIPGCLQGSAVQTPALSSKSRSCLPACPGTTV